MATANLTAHRLRELLSYDSETGRFTRLVGRKGPNCKVGSIAGTNSHGYIIITVDGVIYKAHRLAWLYVHGAWPEFQIDHINGARGDNRITNLRDVTRNVNQQNQLRAKRGTESKKLGVYRNGPGWMARIVVDGIRKYLGTYATPEAAHEAYLVAKRRLHDGCTI